MRDEAVYKFELINELLYWTCVESRYQYRVGELLLVVPADCRRAVLSVA